MKFCLLPIALFPFICLSSLFAQDMTRSIGPVIQDFGPTYTISDPDFPIDPDRMYMVVFDIAESPGAPDQVNPMINTMARFLNMHAQAGIPLENMRVAAVFHGGAAKDALNNEAFKERFGVENPNENLFHQLTEAGVRLYICGQSMGARGLARKELSSSIGVALSAMTVLITLQGEGYQLISF